MFLFYFLSLVLNYFVFLVFSYEGGEYIYINIYIKLYPNSCAIYIYMFLVLRIYVVIYKCVCMLNSRCRVWLSNGSMP